MVDLDKLLRELREKRRVLENEIRLYEQMQKQRLADRKERRPRSAVPAASRAETRARFAGP